VKTATIRSILRRQLVQTPDLPTVVWEQTEHAAPQTATWIEDELRVPSTNVAATDMTASRVLYLLTIHTPPDRVLEELDHLADRIAAVFEPGRTLTDALRTHQLEITTLDTGATRRVATWGYRRLAIAGDARAFRTTLIPA
jgi:hypothetical protein